LEDQPIFAAFLAIDLNISNPNRSIYKPKEIGYVCSVLFAYALIREDFGDFVRIEYRFLVYFI